MMKWVEATFAGHKPNIDRVGMAYMLQGEADPDQYNILLKTPPKGKDWYYVGPHVMLVLPDKDLPRTFQRIEENPRVSARFALAQ
jgi:hypothetical protein